MNGLNTFVLLTTIATCAAVDWCAVRDKYCRDSSHLLCQPVSFPTYSTGAYNIRKLKLTQTLKDTIVAAHNKYRSQVATGQYASLGFQSAANLWETKWDDTLQFTAETHAMYGAMEHDECRATPDYPYSGQNLYQSWTTGKLNETKTIAQGIAAWFNEIKVASPSLVDKLLSSHVNKAGHFSVMIHEKNNRLGCGVALLKEDSDGYTWNSLLLTCNYQYTNMMDERVYKKGTPCSSCRCSTTYKGLCSA